MTFLDIVDIRRQSRRQKMTRQTWMDYMKGRTKNMHKSKEQYKTERCGNEYPFATFNTKMQQEDDDNDARSTG